MPITPVQVLLLSGPAGAGKGTPGWEIAARLRQLGIGHVLLDGDGGRPAMNPAAAREPGMEAVA